MGNVKLLKWYYYFKYSFKFERVIDILKRWFSYFKVSTKVYDFDYSSILEVSRHQIIRVMKSIEKNHHYVGWQNDVAWMKRAIYCLDVLTDREDIFTYDPEILSAEDFDRRHNLILLKKVNLNNFKRFFPKWPLNKENETMLAIELYKEKVWKLYNAIFERYARKWWD